MANQFNANLPKNKELAKQILDSENELNRLKTERGWVGQFWGNNNSIPNNIAALTILLLLLTGIIYTFLNYNCKQDTLSLTIKELWGIITPLITLSIGYVFGDYSGKKKGTP